jgi:hypothetical protein
MIIAGGFNVYSVVSSLGTLPASQAGNPIAFFPQRIFVLCPISRAR